MLEIAGWAIVIGAVAQVGLGVFAMLRRRLADSVRASEEARLFAERAKILLKATQVQQAQSERTWAGTRKFFIDKKQAESDTACSFYLKPHDGHPLPPFKPGQFLTFQLQIPGEAKPVIRCYSLSESPLVTDYYRITVKRLGPPPDQLNARPGLSSSYFHERLGEGDILDVRAPGGSFFLNEDSGRPVVLMAGGVGLTPLLSMLNTICETANTREAWLFYGVANRADHMMQEHLANVDRQHENIHVVVCYSQPTPDCVKGRDYDHAGYCDVELCKKLLPSCNYEFYICGPPPMMRAVTDNLGKWGVPAEDIHFEAFGPASVKSTKAPAGTADEARKGDEFEIVFERSRATLRWTPQCGSILELAEAHDLCMDSGCRAGSCGTCNTAVKAGDVRYISTPDADPGEKCCLPCIAVPSSNLVIDA